MAASKQTESWHHQILLQKKYIYCVKKESDVHVCLERLCKLQETRYLFSDMSDLSVNRLSIWTTEGAQ